MPATRRKKAEDQILRALACGATVESAARTSGISERTIYRRLKDTSFRQRLHEMLADMVTRTSGMLTAASLESVKTLVDLQQSSNPPAVRLGAARAVLELAAKVREAAEVLQRLAALEQQLQNKMTNSPQVAAN